ncbi:MAG: alpha/beta hydrolase [Polyangiaceae bacterium]
MKVAANGLEFEVEREGRGEPLLLLMGIGAQLVLWPAELCERLVRAGFEVVRMDNRDIGLSTHLRHLPVPNPRSVMARAALGLAVEAPYTLADMADDVRAVLDVLGVERVHVVGASMGGMIAQTLAIRHPSRVASLTSIMSTPGDRRYAFMASPLALRALLGPVPRTREESVERMLSMFRVIGSRTHPIDETVLREAAERSYDRGSNPAGFARQFAAIAASGSRREALRSLAVPTLAIHGTQDPLIPVAAGRATARLVPNGRLLELSSMGHDLPRPLWPAMTDAIRSVANEA